MGLLDDAIREHLELKRRHGASNAELEREEAEALGPARRGFATAGGEAEAGAAEEPLGTAGEHLEEPAPSDHEFGDLRLEGERGLDEESPHGERLGAELEPAPPDEERGVEEPFPADDELPSPAEQLAALEDERSRAETVLLEPDLLEDELAPPPFREQAPPGEPGGREPPPEEGEPAPGVEPASEGEPPPEGEDVLEDTPEFLQETPEHDRLWFEQRPPRDFDFD